MLKLFSTPEREIRQTMFERDKYIIWEAGEVIYRAGDPSNDGFYDHGRVRPDFHERGAAAEPHRHERDSGRDVASSQCHPIRTVTAIAASTGAKATRIPMQYFEDIAARDRVTCALIRKSQYRLIDSNTQSNMLGTEIKRLSVLVEHAINNGFSDNTAID